MAAGGGDPEWSLTTDEMLDDISLYWFTGTQVSSARLVRARSSLVQAAFRSLR
jgi:hypothetical protein